MLRFNFFFDIAKEAKTLRFRIILASYFTLVVFSGTFLLLHYLSSEETPCCLANLPEISKPAEELNLPPEIKNYGLEIDKLAVLVPVIENVNGASKKEYDNKLKEGVAHLLGTALPGSKSNIFIFGHSSAWYETPYAKVFARLNELENNDEIIVYYKATKYTYRVSEKRVVQKTDLTVLAPTNEEILTLMTCWPLGTDLKRLIVISKKVEEK